MGNKLYSLVGLNPAMLVQRLASGNFESTKIPKVAADIATPDVTAGRAVFKDLTEGGLFNFSKKSLIVERLHAKSCTPVWKILIQTGPTTFETIQENPAVPFTLAPGQLLGADATGAVGAEIGCMVKLHVKQGLL